MEIVRIDLGAEYYAHDVVAILRRNLWMDE
jgi:hypothetical protein